MEKMNDLRDLLKHEISDLHSAEEQIIKALPAMIGKATNPELKKSLKDHLKVTKRQLERLEHVQHQLDDLAVDKAHDKKGLLARLFKRSHVCKGMQGLIEEGEKVMGEDMSPEVLDAAIIACAQKIEHYEICGYGTAKAFALELNLAPVAKLLDQTLVEEYDADDLLTKLAVERLNKKAENASEKSKELGRNGGKKQKPEDSNTDEKTAGNKNATSKAKATNKSTKVATERNDNQAAKGGARKSSRKAVPKAAK